MHSSAVVVVLVLCAAMCLHRTQCYVIPQGKNDETHLSQTSNHIDQPESVNQEEGYQVVLKSPTQVLKVEVVNDGQATMQEMEVTQDDTDADRGKRSHSDPERQDGKRNVQCNWKRLYSQYLKRHQGPIKERRKDIRNAFKVVCDNFDEFFSLIFDAKPDDIDDEGR